jgi:hypothetical protein
MQSVIPELGDLLAQVSFVKIQNGWIAALKEPGASPLFSHKKTMT